ncbi:MAG: hypothetical protein KF785_15450 [Gemmatimonadales bacterium]|nr:hypothetical protein [Gemmatimonadales bacterium]
MSTHQERWRRDWADAKLEPPDAVAPLLNRYREPHRAYHTVQHLDECFAWLDRVRHDAVEPHLVSLALWYHDAIYDPHRSDNEAASADLAVASLRHAGADATVLARVTELILATRHSALPSPGDPTLLVDIDLAILGAPPARFAEYEAQIRAEYRWVPGLVFRRRRAMILRGFLDRPALYHTALLHQELEARARSNLAAALSELGGQR